MESYLVRIYRRKENNPHLLIGVAEEPGVKGKKAFSNLWELWDILNPVKKIKRTPKKNSDLKHNQK